MYWFVYQGAFVGGIHGHAAVVAPAERGRLRSCAAGGDGLALAHVTGRVGGRMAGVADRRPQVPAGDAEAEADVAGAVDRGASHPAVRIVRRVRSLLVEHGPA